MKTQISKTTVEAQVLVNNLSEELLMADIACRKQEEAVALALLDADIAYRKQEEAIAEALLFVE